MIHQLKPIWLLALLLLAMPVFAQTAPAPGARTLVQGAQGVGNTRLSWPVVIGGADGTDAVRALQVNSSGGLVTAAAGTITTTNTITALGGSVTLTSLPALATVGAVVTGTWTATLAFEGSVDGTNWVSIVAPIGGSTAFAATSTANGTFWLPAAGFTSVRVTATAYTSGTATVTLLAGNGVQHSSVHGVLAHAGAYTSINPILIGWANNDNALFNRWLGGGNTSDNALWSAGGGYVQTISKIYNGGTNTYDRLRTAGGASGTTGAGLLGAGAMAFDGTNWQQVGANGTGSHWLQVGTRSAATVQADGASNTPTVATNAAGTALTQPAIVYESNGTTFDRRRNNVEANLLTIAAGTATQVSADQTNHNATGVTIYTSVTVNPGGAQTLKIDLQVKDEVGNDQYYTVATSGAIAVFGAGATATGLEVIQLGSGCTETTALVGWTTQSLQLPRTWRVQVVHSAAGAWTYKVSHSYLQ